MDDPTISISGWIEDLATAVSRLSEDQLLVLASCVEIHEVAPSLPAHRLQRALSISTSDAAHLARDLEQVLAASGVSRRDVAVALVSLARSRSLVRNREETVEVVCTAPSRLGVPVRTTFATAVEMLRAARKEIFVVGYVFTEGARGLAEEVALAHRNRRVRATFIGNRMEDHLSVLYSIWPDTVPPPRIFSRKQLSSDNMASLHAKLLTCDDSEALITSANFSYHGLRENIEVGVKIRSDSVSRLVEFLRAMIRTGEVERVEWGS